MPKGNSDVRGRRHKRAGRRHKKFATAVVEDSVLEPDGPETIPEPDGLETLPEPDGPETMPESTDEAARGLVESVPPAGVDWFKPFDPVVEAATLPTPASAPEVLGPQTGQEAVHDDLPGQLRQAGRRANVLDDVSHKLKKQRVYAACPELIEAFAAERSEGRAKADAKKALTGKKRGELKLKEITKADEWTKMQTALEKEWGTWSKYSAVEVIDPGAAKKVDPKFVLESRAVWTDKSENGVFAPKCRVVGRGFQEKYDESLRRDSPTASTQMTNMLCSLSASLKLKLYTADVTGAFLQGKKIERELYFRMPSNLGKCALPGVEAGSLLKLNKSIYGTNDAARAWYTTLRASLETQGWRGLAFEPGTFIYREESTGRILGLMVLHVDDFLIGVAPGDGDFLLEQLAKGVDLGSLKSCDSSQTFCGREYVQKPDHTVVITMVAYAKGLDTFSLPRPRSKLPESKLTPVEHRGFRKVLG